MLWRKCCYRSVLKPTALLVLALLWGETLLQVAAPILPELLQTRAAEAQAMVGIIDPDGNGTVAGALNGCTPATNFECVNDAARSPTAPANTTSDFVKLARDQSDNYTMGTIANVSSVSSITVFMYHRENRNSFFFNVGLYAANETTQYGTTQQLPNRATAQWDSLTFSGLSLNQAQLNDLRIRTTCIRNGGGNSDCDNFALYAQVTYTESNAATVSAVGTQQAVSRDTSNQYLGGSFAVVGNSGSANVTSVTIAETGTVDAQANLSNIKLFYETDVTTPFNCAGESYGGGETQYGGTVTGGFSAANGTATFTGSVGISTSAALCLYVVVDVGSGATAGDTVEVQITNPSTQVVGNNGLLVSPATAVAIPGTSTVSEATLTQTGYHWRNDDGSETAASSATGGTENSPYANFPKATGKRLRVQVSNEGNTTSASTQYRLEYVSKSGFSFCSDVTSGWTDVGAGGGDFDMFNSANLTDGNNTTDVSTGGVSNPGGKTFLGTNAAVKDTSSQTSGITLSSTQFVELEYSIASAAGVSDGSTYCFRVTDAGTTLPDYTNYPELTIAADLDVSASGSHTASASIPSTNTYSGGTYIINDTGGAANTITQISITETGTVDAQNSLANVELRYDLDVSAPYTCTEHSYDVTDTSFGSPTTFNGGNIATFTGSVSVSTSQAVCLYVEYDVTASSSNADTVRIEISNPSSDITATSATVAPASAVAPTDSTELQRASTTVSDYHWRNNDGNETGATSATAGVQNTPYASFPKETTVRLRLAIGNVGLAAAAETTYQLEWAQKVVACENIASWTPLDEPADEWEMAPNVNFAQGDDTTDIAEGIGGVGTPAGFFLTNNNGFADTLDETGSTTLPADNYLDAEYSIRATDVSVQGAAYCFRVTANGMALDSYQAYPEATIKLDTDFKVQRGISTITGETLTITAGVDYEAPDSATTSFIRITNTHLTGAGSNGGSTNSNADDVTVYISNPGNITSSITFTRAAFTTSNTRISWEIVEYTGAEGGENSIYVRDVSTATYGTAATTVSGSTVTGVVDNNDVAVFITAQYNPDSGRNNYQQGLSTAAWNSGTSQPDFTRNATGGAVITSYAVVEFTGTNWRVQRGEHTYTSAGSTETESITAVNNLSRAFVHAQKRTSQNNHADFGHEVWLSGLGQISFRIDGQAATPADHTSVAWVIENMQTQGVVMDVTRSNGGLTAGAAAPVANLVPITDTLTDLAISSIFVTNNSDGTSRSWPEPMLGVRIANSTQYELWRSDDTSNITYRTEVVEWPTAARKLDQNYFRIYENNGLLEPVNAWSTGTSTLGENEPMTADDSPMAPGDVARIRMTLTVSASAMPAGLDSFKLQYASTTGSCGAAGTWQDVGAPGSGALWRGFDNASTTDGVSLDADPPTGGLLISIATIAGTYEENNNSALNPYTAFPGDELEYDWVVQHNGAEDKTTYCFRMTESGGTLLNSYSQYPVLRTVGFDPRIANWRWYGDETSATPVTPLAGENIAPNNIDAQDAIKLRLVLEESSGADGENVKFALQVSEYSDFSQAVSTLTATSSCEGDSLWCYFDGAGEDNARITSAVISGADTCTTGAEAGCGTRNEATSTVGATFDQIAFSNTEYEFTVLQAGARVNTVYYFRLYDLVNDEIVPLASGASYPSLVTEGAAMTVNSTGNVPGGTVAGITLTATTTPTSISFGRVPFDQTWAAAQTIAVNTNATEGYQLLLQASGQLTNTYGQTLLPINSSNATTSSWSSACLSSATSCLGYHSTDASLSNGSTRFAATDSYAALSTEPEEIFYSSIPTNDTFDMLYRLEVTEAQESGVYEATLQYIAVPVY